MDFSKATKTKLKVNTNNVKIVKEKKNIEEKIIDYKDEPVQSKWESKYSNDIIKLFHIAKYDYNYLLNKCDINNFMEFVTKYSNVYDPYPIEEDDEEEEELYNEEEYFSN
tara:strand:- start:4935 stop:5264 length:330 start_codon:yes stop_codon:yes gene_type:complete